MWGSARTGTSDVTSDQYNEGVYTPYGWIGGRGYRLVTLGVIGGSIFVTSPATNTPEGY